MLKCPIEECLRRSNKEGCQECEPTPEEKEQAIEYIMQKVRLGTAQGFALYKAITETRWNDTETITEYKKVPPHPEHFAAGSTFELREVREDDAV